MVHAETSSMLHLIVTVTCGTGRLVFDELVQATARVDVQLFTKVGSGSLCEHRTSRKTFALFTLVNRLQL